MKRNAILRSHGQGKLRIQEAIEEFKNQLDPFFFLKNGFAWNLDQGPCLFFAELFPGMQMNSDIKA